MSATLNAYFPTQDREDVHGSGAAKTASHTMSRSDNQGTAQEHRVSFADLQEPLPDLVCFSHLRWDFVFQRPQHLLSRFAKQIRVFFIEEPIFDAARDAAYMDLSSRTDQLQVAVPHLPGGLSETENEKLQRQLVNQLIAEQQIRRFIAWYYTPMALGFSSHLYPDITVYDCMDELAAFAGAHPLLLDRERQLFNRADLVFTGGQSLYEAKRNQHKSVYAFPSSIERDHFAQARTQLPDPADQATIPHPRLGFFGVIDERMDINLVAEVASMRPDWHIIMLGPVVKIDPAHLPQASNLYYLGMKSYKELPAYISGWDVALLTFALNESTRYISPTKTPEYLAAGKPVVSTPITDVVRPYGELKLVHIAGTSSEFVDAVERALKQTSDTEWLTEVDNFLSQTSWDKTWAHMTHLICSQLLSRTEN